MNYVAKVRKLLARLLLLSALSIFIPYSFAEQSPISDNQSIQSEQIIDASVQTTTPTNVVDVANEDDANTEENETKEEFSVFTMIQVVLGGLGIFLIGMKLMSDGMQAIAGERLNKLIGAVTNNRFFAVLAGIGVTCVIQSSSATTVMVVGFVNSGLMTLLQAIGVIFGANIGTTLSLWILTLNISDYGPLIIGAAAFVYLFAKKERSHFIGMSILGLGMLFFGLQLMSDGFAPLRNVPELKDYLHMFTATTTAGFLKSALVGAFITAIIQSSAAVIVMVMGLASTGVLTFETAVALILGSNIGTTITAAFACIGASRNAIRAALAHTLFNVIGVLVVVVIHEPFTSICESIIRSITNNPDGPLNLKFSITCVHTIFNLSATILLLPFMELLAKIVTILIPIHKSENKSEKYKPKYLDTRLLHQTPVAIAQAQKEIDEIGNTCVEMLSVLDEILKSDSRMKDKEEFIFGCEDNIDIAQKDITQYVSTLLHDNITYDYSLAVRREIRQIDEFESVSDYIRNALKAYLKILNAGENLTDVAKNEVGDLTNLISEQCKNIIKAIDTNDKSSIEAIEEQSKVIESRAKQYRDAHTQRITISCTTPVKCLVYSDLLGAYRRMNDHLLNIIQTLHS